MHLKWTSSGNVDKWFKAVVLKRSRMVNQSILIGAVKLLGRPKQNE